MKVSAVSCFLVYSLRNCGFLAKTTISVLKPREMKTVRKLWVMWHEGIWKRVGLDLRVSLIRKIKKFPWPSNEKWTLQPYLWHMSLYDFVKWCLIFLSDNTSNVIVYQYINTWREMNPWRCFGFTCWERFIIIIINGSQ